MCFRYLLQLFGWDVFPLSVQESSTNNAFVRPSFFIPWQYWSREGWDHAQQCKTKAKTSMQSTFPSQGACTLRMEMRLLDIWGFQGGSETAKVGKANKSIQKLSTPSTLLILTYSMCKQHQTITDCWHSAWRSTRKLFDTLLQRSHVAPFSFAMNVALHSWQHCRFKRHYAARPHGDMWSKAGLKRPSHDQKG